MSKEARKNAEAIVDGWKTITPEKKEELTDLLEKQIDDAADPALHKVHSVAAE